MPGQNAAVVFRARVQLHIARQLETTAAQNTSSKSLLSTMTSPYPHGKKVCVPTLALIIVGRGSRIPCIFLKAGMTKRLHVTTADTGLPGTNRRSVGQSEGVTGREREKGGK